MFSSRTRKKDGKDALAQKGAQKDSSLRVNQQQSTEEFGEPNSLPPLVTDVMNELNLGWEYMTVSEFNPVPHALALLDESSLGRDYNAFCGMYEKLERAMDLIVNDYHQAFNTAIQTFSSVVENISDSKRRVKEMRENLDKSKDWLQCKRFDMLHLWIKSIQLKEMNRILEAVEELHTTPDRLEILIQEKHFLTAVRTLLAAIRTLNGADFMDIGALEATKDRLTEIRRVSLVLFCLDGNGIDARLSRKNLHETLLEELHDHLYLKSPYAAATIDTRKLANFIASALAYVPMHIFRKTVGIRSDANDATQSDEDLELNPEENSLQYMRNLLEALHLLGRLPHAIEITRDRLPVKFYHVVERTIQEIEQRQPTTTSTRSRMTDISNSRYPDLIGQHSRSDQTTMLYDLLKLLYQKYQTIIRGHSFILDVIAEIHEAANDEKIGHNMKLTHELAYTINDVWTTVQNEIKALLHDYLTVNDRTAAPTSLIMSMNDLMKQKTRNRERDGMPVFRIGDAFANESLLGSYQQLDPQMQTVAVQPSPDTAGVLTEDSAIGASGLPSGIVDKYASTVATGHRLLVTPDANNVLVAYKPTYEFIMEVESGGVVRNDTLRQFLDEFVLKTFLSQMQSRTMGYFQTYVNGLDAFHTELATDLSAYPLIKSAVALTTLVKAMCRSLLLIPVHQEDFVSFIEGILQAFSEKCSFRYRTLVSADLTGFISDSSVVVSSVWIQEREIANVLGKNTLYRVDVEPNLEVNQNLSQRETVYEMKLKKERSFHRSELIFDMRKLQALANLHHSLRWFSTQISSLRSHGSPQKDTDWGEAGKIVEGSNLSLDSHLRWSLDSLPELQLHHQSAVGLLLSAEMGRRFTRVLGDLESLSETCIFVLRVEIRCHAMYYLDLAMREGNYCLEDEVYEPNPYIGQLNQDLTNMEEVLTSMLPDRKIRFLFDGLALLIAHALCANLRHIKRVNHHGVQKLIRNVRSLQQNLTNVAVVHEKKLDRAKVYYELLDLKGEGLVSFMEQNPGRFTYDEYKVVLDLIFADALASEASGERKKYDACLQKMKDYFVKHR
ncbi:hypothetical protein HK097_006960 [Rhizophlyctis rosea]|uniref:Exocyst complex component Sec8 n=1 Tax=Rhizophlyctis rosea TaxID=64517 RepID=A0AAD5X691_9FUNG|nr:hypothetical protein HK097_006960 [Rhizophlyctis rosea]